MNMTSSEVSKWVAFINKRGSIFTGRRIEQGIGNLMAAYFSSNGARNVKSSSFMPHEDQPKEMSLEEYMMQSFGGEPA